jgi:hypothetical protein
MGIGPNCCCCWSWSDDFNRSDASTPGDDWIVSEDGDARIDSNRLGLYPTDPPTVVRALNAAPSSTMRVCATIVDSVEQQYAIRFAWDPVENDYLLLTWTPAASGTTPLTLSYVNGGVEQEITDTDTYLGAYCLDLATPSPSIATSESVTICLWWHNWHLGLSVAVGSGSPTYYSLRIPPVAGLSLGGYVGLEHRGGDDPTFFDNFSVSDIVPHDMSCPDSCLVRHEDELTLTIVKLDGTCTSEVDGLDTQLVRVANTFAWLSANMTDIRCRNYASGTPPYYPVLFHLQCDLSNPGTFTLRRFFRPFLDPALTPCDIAAVSQPEWTFMTFYSYQRSPFILEFRGTLPWCCAPGTSETPSGTYRFILTE